MTPIDMSSLVESAGLTVPMAMAMGLAFGAGPCNITCLPYLGPVLVAKEPSRPWRTVLPFSLGRLVGYALLGLVAGFLGHALQAWIKSPVVGWLLGGATVAVGLSLLWRQLLRSQWMGRWRAKRQVEQAVVSVSMSTALPILSTSVSEKHVGEKQACSKQACGKPGVVLPGGLFMMGMGMALNPCAPLGTVLLAASATGSTLAGLGLGLGFGLGAVVIPTVLFVYGVAHFGRQLREHMSRWKPGLEISASALLILLGVGTVLGWIRP